MSWLANAAFGAITLGAVAALLYPNFFAVAGWLWGPLTVAGFALLISACLVFVQRPFRQAYSAALTGLSRQQRAQISRALRHGEIPSEPRVLVAAVKVGTLRLTHTRRALHGSRTLIWLTPAFLSLAGVLSFLSNDIRRGVFFVGFALYFAIYYAWLGYRKDQLTTHVESLRASAEADDTPVDVDYAAPPRRLKMSIPLFIVAGIATVTIAYLSDRPNPDCRTVDSVANFNFKTNSVLTARLTADADLASYRDWSNQLQTYAQQASTPDIARRLHRIADLSVQAVAQRQAINNDEIAGRSSDVIHSDQSAYLSTISELLDEQQALISTCRRS
ncbi:hypothetical protein [Mycobacterium sp. 1245852.3]|uniref:hypothetical protein n=1 Tax=Mycobacterium sp. 1245852.3 TaxID=1856860 RepID=UPI000801BB00|nr:hypothetical protein [Mycobacterium sp. 1245852.3]OBK12824.1 hypothetical protein A9W96_10385 [Mycobacterium sp. 1245852.3]